MTAENGIAIAISQPVGAAAGEDEQGPTVVVRETTGEQLADHVGRLLGGDGDPDGDAGDAEAARGHLRADVDRDPRPHHRHGEGVLGAEARHREDPPVHSEIREGEALDASVVVVEDEPT